MNSELSSRRTALALSLRDSHGNQETAGEMETARKKNILILDDDDGGAKNLTEEGKGSVFDASAFSLGNEEEDLKRALELSEVREAHCNRLAVGDADFRDLRGHHDEVVISNSLPDVCSRRCEVTQLRQLRAHIDEVVILSNFIIQKLFHMVYQY